VRHPNRVISWGRLPDATVLLFSSTSLFWESRQIFVSGWFKHMQNEVAFVKHQLMSALARRCNVVARTTTWPPNRCTLFDLRVQSLDQDKVLAVSWLLILSTLISTSLWPSSSDAADFGELTWDCRCKENRFVRQFDPQSRTDHKFVQLTLALEGCACSTPLPTELGCVSPQSWSR
jgi:hypothetical protein